MKRRKIIARVLDAGQCRYYRAGQEFALDGFTPKGLCDSAYSVLSRDAQTMAYGGMLPWHMDDAVRTRCPDPAGAVWELQYAESPVSRPSQRKETSPCPDGPLSRDTFKVEACRGKEGECRCALAELAAMKTEIESVIGESGWNEFLQRRLTGPLLPHQRLRVALAACPNACSLPQIRNIGLIASVRPVRISSRCTGCGQCAETCREKAIIMVAGLPELDAMRCVGCGQCGKACPEGAWEMSELRFRILLDGRMGRHPRLATELATLSLPEVRPAVGRALAELMRNDAHGPEALSEAAARTGADRLEKAVRGGAGGAT